MNKNAINQVARTYQRLVEAAPPYMLPEPIDPNVGPQWDPQMRQALLGQERIDRLGGEEARLEREQQAFLMHMYQQLLNQREICMGNPFCDMEYLEQQIRWFEDQLGIISG
jgi:hypothetical protein